MNPTQEQLAAIAAAKTGETRKIGAGAGTGKTTTLEMVGRALAPRMGVYIAFNYVTAQEMAARLTKNGIRNVESRTAHSFANRGVGVRSRFPGKLEMRQGPWMIGDWCSVPHDGIAGRRRGAVIRAIGATVRMFQQSADQEIDEGHVPFEHLRWAFGPDRSMETDLDCKEFRTFVTRAAKHYWNLMLNDRKVGITHDFYLKLWHLEGARIGGGGGFGGPAVSFILSDESQDLNGVMAAILAEQNIQVVYVGDEHQQIYAWRGSVNAMQKINAPSTFLTQSFRWGPEVATVANAILALKEPLPPQLSGDPSKTTTLGPLTPGDRYTLICRTNAYLFASALDLTRNGRRIAVVGSLDGPIRLMESGYALWSGRGKVVDPDIAIFQAWDELTLAAEDDPTLGLVVRMVEEHQHNLPAMCTQLRHAGEVSEERADVVLTTCHKAKGREWDNVQMAADFRSHLERLRNGLDIYDEEVNVLYVAATRARRRLALNSAATELLEPGAIAEARAEGDLKRRARVAS